MNTSAFVLYCLAGLADLSGLVLLAVDLRGRVKKLRSYVLRRTPSEELPLTWNEDLNVIQTVLAAHEPVLIEARTRGALNELTELISSERTARHDAEERVAALAGAGERPGRLLLTGALLAAGTILGLSGNIVGSLGC